MKNNTKSSITLPTEELEQVTRLMKRLKAKSKVEVVRQGLKLLEDKLDAVQLKENFRQASLKVRGESLAAVNSSMDLIDEVPE